MILTGDCIEVMATLDAEAFDAIVTDPPYGLEFMGKKWDRIGESRWRNDSDADRAYIAAQGNTLSARRRAAPVYGTSSKTMQDWHHRWALAALRVAKPGAYILAFGGTRTSHRLAAAIEDAGWIIRDTLCWVYATGFPKSKALLKPAWEPIVMARKPGPLRALAIDECRIGFTSEADRTESTAKNRHGDYGTPQGGNKVYGDFTKAPPRTNYDPPGRWPANVVLTDPVFDGDTEGVVGGGEMARGHFPASRPASVFQANAQPESDERHLAPTTYSRFFLIPKPSTAERGAGNEHPTVKPLALMRHLVRLVTPRGGVVLDPFLGSGTTALAADREGFAWVGIEREPEYIAIAERRLAEGQRGLAL